MINSDDKKLLQTVAAGGRRVFWLRSRFPQEAALLLARLENVPRHWCDMLPSQKTRSVLMCFT